MGGLRSGRKQETYSLLAGGMAGMAPFQDYPSASNSADARHSLLLPILPDSSRSLRHSERHQNGAIVPVANWNQADKDDDREFETEQTTSLRDRIPESEYGTDFFSMYSCCMPECTSRLIAGPF